MKVKLNKIITNPGQFEERVDEVVAATGYDFVASAISELKDCLYDNPDIPALCAPQIGYPLRLFVVRLSKKEDDRFKVFINPMIISHEGYHLSREYSPSFPDSEYLVARFNKVHVAFQTSDGHVDSQSFIGAYGEVVQQMIQMLDGLTLEDFGLNLNDVGGADEFDNASDKEKIQVIQMYFEHLSQYSDSLQKEIQSNPDLKNLNDQINLLTGLASGDITPVRSSDAASDKQDTAE